MTEIPKQRQLEALVSGRSRELAAEYAGGDYQKLEALYTITLAELVAFAREHGLPSTWVHRQPGRADGLYIVPSGERWLVYEQERGMRLDVLELADEATAFEHLIATYYLPRSCR